MPKIDPNQRLITEWTKTTGIENLLESVGKFSGRRVTKPSSSLKQTELHKLAKWKLKGAKPKSRKKKQKTKSTKSSSPKTTQRFFGTWAGGKYLQERSTKAVQSIFPSGAKFDNVKVLNTAYPKAAQVFKLTIAKESRKFFLDQSEVVLKIQTQTDKAREELRVHQIGTQIPEVVQLYGGYNGDFNPDWLDLRANPDAADIFKDAFARFPKTQRRKPTKFTVMWMQSLTNSAENHLFQVAKSKQEEAKAAGKEVDYVTPLIDHVCQVYRTVLRHLEKHGVRLLDAATKNVGWTQENGKVRIQVIDLGETEEFDPDKEEVIDDQEGILRKSCESAAKSTSRRRHSSRRSTESTQLTPVKDWSKAIARRVACKAKPSTGRHHRTRRSLKLES